MCWEKTLTVVWRVGYHNSYTMTTSNEWDILPFWLWLASLFCHQRSRYPEVYCNNIANQRTSWMLEVLILASHPSPPHRFYARYIGHIYALIPGTHPLPAVISQSTPQPTHNHPVAVPQSSLTRSAADPHLIGEKDGYICQSVSPLHPNSSAPSHTAMQ